MKISSKTGLSVLASAVLLLINSSAFADRNEGNHGTHGTYGIPSTVTNLGATLVGATGFTGTGSIRYTSSTNGGSLHASIHLPVDGITILDSNSAVGNTYTLTVSSGATTVATCSLVISDVDFSYSTTSAKPTEVAEFVTSVSESGTTYTASVGNCGTSTISLPVLAASDTVSISLNGATPILSGTLATLVGR